MTRRSISRPHMCIGRSECLGLFWMTVCQGFWDAQHSAELVLGYSSDDGLGQADIKLIMDNIAGGTRSSWNVSIERKF